MRRRRAQDRVPGLVQEAEQVPELVHERAAARRAEEIAVARREAQVVGDHDVGFVDVVAADEAEAKLQDGQAVVAVDLRAVDEAHFVLAVTVRNAAIAGAVDERAVHDVDSLSHWRMPFQ